MAYLINLWPIRQLYHLSRDRLTRYIVAVISVVVALLLTLLLQSLVKSTVISLLENYELADSTQKFAQIQVKDTGIGIKPEFIPHVFESFRQADNATTRNFGGLGLGLAIVRHLVERHSGTVEAQSMGEGQGATFIVRLPLLQDREEIEKNHNSKAISHLTCASSLLAGLKVLVVDDEPDIRELLVFILEQHGMNVSTAASTEQALQFLANSEQDLLISDIGMPNVNGYMLIQEIRASEVRQYSQIPAIALSGYARELDKKQAQSAGFQKSLAKPVEQAELIAAIANLTGRSF
ncbi:MULTISPECIES: ATP-binding response regulator [Fischerella]|uniref:ATP-binding response regulator n=1 Tax=Fischerella TaxID=1190 RepID=UPI0002F36F23|nr:MULTISPECIES: response regulator [Fischerella]